MAVDAVAAPFTLSPPTGPIANPLWQHQLAVRTRGPTARSSMQQEIQWGEVAKEVGQSKEWTAAACLGQMTLDKEQARVLGDIFGLTADEQKWLQVVSYKGTLPTSVPTDPLIYRWYEIVSVYGTTIKELIHEEFGDGIMSAIDFSMDIQRQADPQR